MLDAVQQTYGSLSMPARSICVPADSDPEQIFLLAQALIAELGQNQGILVLTDIFGSTPSNIAHQLHNGHDVITVSGLSLSMLLRVFNYPNAPLSELAQKAVSAGREGVISAC